MFDHLSLVEHDQPIHGGDGVQSMVDSDHGFAFHQLVQAFLNGVFYFGIQCAGRLVE